MDRSSGKSVTIAFFDTEENLNAAEPTFDEEMPKQLGDLIGPWAGRGPSSATRWWSTSTSLSDPRVVATPRTRGQMRCLARP